MHEISNTDGEFSNSLINTCRSNIMNLIISVAEFEVFLEFEIFQMRHSIILIDELGLLMPVLKRGKEVREKKTTQSRLFSSSSSRCRCNAKEAHQIQVKNISVCKRCMLLI